MQKGTREKLIFREGYISPCKLLILRMRDELHG
jgi:hypothetical protein